MKRICSSYSLLMCVDECSDLANQFGEYFKKQEAALGYVPAVSFPSTYSSDSTSNYTDICIIAASVTTAEKMEST